MGRGVPGSHSRTRTACSTPSAHCNVLTMNPTEPPHRTPKKCIPDPACPEKIRKCWQPPQHHFVSAQPQHGEGDVESSGLTVLLAHFKFYKYAQSCKHLSWTRSRQSLLIANPCPPPCSHRTLLSVGHQHHPRQETTSLHPSQLDALASRMCPEVVRWWWGRWVVSLCPFVILFSKPVLSRSPSRRCSLPTSPGGGTSLCLFAFINSLIKHPLTASWKTLN